MGEIFQQAMMPDAIQAGLTRQDALYNQQQALGGLNQAVQQFQTGNPQQQQSALGTIYQATNPQMLGQGLAAYPMQQQAAQEGRVKNAAMLDQYNKQFSAEVYQNVSQLPPDQQQSAYDGYKTKYKAQTGEDMVDGHMPEMNDWNAAKPVLARQFAMLHPNQTTVEGGVSFTKDIYGNILNTHDYTDTIAKRNENVARVEAARQRGLGTENAALISAGRAPDSVKEAEAVRQYPYLQSYFDKKRAAEHPEYKDTKDANGNPIVYSGVTGATTAIPTDPTGVIAKAKNDFLSGADPDGAALFNLDPKAYKMAADVKAKQQENYNARFQSHVVGNQLVTIDKTTAKPVGEPIDLRGASPVVKAKIQAVTDAKTPEEKTAAMNDLRGEAPGVARVMDQHEHDIAMENIGQERVDIADRNSKKLKTVTRPDGSVMMLDPITGQEKAQIAPPGTSPAQAALVAAYIRADNKDDEAAAASQLPPKILASAVSAKKALNENVNTKIGLGIKQQNADTGVQSLAERTQNNQGNLTVKQRNATTGENNAITNAGSLSERTLNNAAVLGERTQNDQGKLILGNRQADNTQTHYNNQDAVAARNATTGESRAATYSTQVDNTNQNQKAGLTYKYDALAQKKEYDDASLARQTARDATYAKAVDNTMNFQQRQVEFKKIANDFQERKLADETAYRDRRLVLLEKQADRQQNNSKFQKAQNLGKQFDLKTKRYMTVLDTVADMERLYKQQKTAPSGIAQQVMLTYMAKIADATTGVKEGERTVYGNAQGFMDQVAQFKDKLSKGQYSKTIADEIMATARNMRDIAAQEGKIHYDSYNERAKRAGLEPEDVTGSSGLTYFGKDQSLPQGVNIMDVQRLMRKTGATQDKAVQFLQAHSGQ